MRGCAFSPSTNSIGTTLTVVCATAPSEAEAESSKRDPVAFAVVLCFFFCAPGVFVSAFVVWP